MKNEQKQTTGKKSKYAEKIRLKLGSGGIDPKWMWWTEGELPRRFKA